MVGLDTPESPDTKPMKAGGADSAICLVIGFEPVVNLFDVLEVVDMVGRWGSIGKPDELGRVEDGSNDQFIFGMGVVYILNMYI